MITLVAVVGGHCLVRYAKAWACSMLDARIVD